MHHAKLKQTKFTIRPKKKGPITPSRHAPLSHYHANYVAISRITPWKKSQSCHQVMHHFQAIPPIILLFHKSRPEQKKKKKMANHTTTPTAKAVSLKCLLLYNHLKNTFKRIFKYLL